MDLLDGMGRELVWGLLALRQRFISQAALLAAIDAWHGRPEQPLGQVLLEQQAIDPDQAAKVDVAIQNILDRQDSDPLEIFHAVALGEALGGVLEQVPDPEWRSRLRRAVKSVGIEEAATSSLTVTSASGGSVALPATDEDGRRDGTIGLAAMKLALDPRSAVPSDPAGKHVKLPGPSRDPDDAPGQPGDPSDIEHGAGGDGADSQTTFPPGRDESGPAQPPLAGMSTLPTRYRILRPLAEGGLGAVFAAHDEELHREVALVVGLSAGSIALGRERARTDHERALAVKYYRYAYEAAETMLSRVGDVDLADIPQMEGIRLELLETARIQFQNLLQQQSHDPEVLLLEGRTRARLGDVLEMLGLYAEAEQNDRAAINLLKILKGRCPEDDRPLRAQARASHGLGVLLYKMNRFKAAETALREAPHLREQLAARFPDDPASIRALAESRYYLGALLVRLANPRPQDKALYHQAVKDQERKGKRDVTDIDSS